MHTPGSLMALHATTLFTHNAQQLMLKINEPWPGAGPAARLFLGRATDGTHICRFRDDVPEELARELAAVCAKEPQPADMETAPVYFDRYITLLAAQQFELGPSYLVPPAIKPTVPLVMITPENIPGLVLGTFGWLAREISFVQPCVGLLAESRIVAVCRSVRITEEAHEAGLETDPLFRGKGYAGETVAGWAMAVRGRGALPMYSTAWENTASRRVAGKLGLYCYGTAFTVS